jgi:hypothetical protein
VKSLFISHAVKDKELVDALIELLEGGIGLSKDAIFCSSSEVEAFQAARILPRTCERGFRKPDS